MEPALATLSLRRGSACTPCSKGRPSVLAFAAPAGASLALGSRTSKRIEIFFSSTVCLLQLQAGNGTSGGKQGLRLLLARQCASDAHMASAIGHVLYFQVPGLRYRNDCRTELDGLPGCDGWTGLDWAERAGRHVHGEVRMRKEKDLG